MAYELLPLKWTKHVNTIDGSISYSAPTVFCSLNVSQVLGDDDKVSSRWQFDWCVDEYHDEGCEQHPTLAAAKRAAQAWYESRIMPALKPTDQPAEGA